MRKNKGWCWFVHHQVKLEYCTDFAGRVEYIKKNKDFKEVPARLFALRFVKGRLPKELVETWAAWDKTWYKARTTYDEAWITYKRARAACKSQIDKLFAKECGDIPWDEENQTLIFE